MSFLELGLVEPLINTLRDLEYKVPTPIQVQAIPVILGSHDLLARAQTGTGKTAAFTLPLLQLLMPPSQQDTATSTTSALIEKNIRALILTPTRELAQQVHKSVERYSRDLPLVSALAYGGVSLNPQIAAIEKGVDIIVATPGRLLDLVSKGTVKLDKIECLVFDEADRMLDMGFMGEINRILKRVPTQRQTLLFSATFSDEIYALSKTLTSSPKIIEIGEKNTAATEVEQVIYNVDADKKRELLSYMIGSKNWHQVLVFTRTKQGADLLAKEMTKDGVKTKAIHGDKSQGAREKELQEFKDGNTRALVATDVAARGLDIEQLNYVVNFELPYNAEDYIHRIGRTGRAGQKGLAISLVSSDENYLLEEIEAITDIKFMQQWYPGFEPDLNKPEKRPRKHSKGAQKKRARERALDKSGSGRVTKRK